jgi:large repetitive protein
MASSAAIGNGSVGVDVSDQAVGNTVGGTMAGAGNVISGNQSSGVFISDAGTTGNLVAGNLIGTDGTGAMPIANTYQGVFIGGGATGNTVGGTAAGARNVISGNNGDGVDITNTGTSQNVVVGNYIGTDTTGGIALGNTTTGLSIYGGATGNTIGGSTAAAANIISGNAGDGVDISGQGTSNNLIEGDSIGTDATGTMRLGNAGAGVSIFDNANDNTIGGSTAVAGNTIANNGDAPGDGIDINGVNGIVIQAEHIQNNSNAGIRIEGGAQSNTIGGTTAAAANIISGNKGAGVVLSGDGTSANVLESNLIGTDATGTFAVGNGYVGVQISDGATNNTIGSTAAGSGNVISGNQSSDVYITGTGTTGNVVTANFIGTDITATMAIGNAYQGVLISGGAASNTIGGTVAGSGNIISGNRTDGVDIVNSGSNSNLVAANIIGADITGGLPLGNGGAGVGISNGASQNMIGGNTNTAANIIAGNFGDGIDITSDSISDKVDGNHIGVNAAGTQAVPNGGSGIVISGANHISIGGAEPGQGNVIAANNGIGIFIFGAGTIDNTIQGNLVGTDENGTAALGNGSNGIDISDGASNNTVGGTADSKGNVISGNLSSGVFISDKGTTGKGPQKINRYT